MNGQANAFSRALKVAQFFSLLIFTQVLFAQTPSISPAVANQNDFPATPICVDIPLINSGAPGYGPYLQLITPIGITFNSASLFGLAITPINVGVFPPAPGNQLNDPLISQPVTGPEGDTLLLIEPPIGSVVAGGPPLAINVCYTLDISAQVNVPLTISATPVYKFGDTPTGDNGPIIGIADTFDSTPLLVRFRKEDFVPESERPPGPSWPVTYVLTADIANGNTIDNIVIADTLPSNFVLTSTTVIPAAPDCTVTAGATLVANCATITGTNADDVVVTYTGYYDDVLDEAACGTDTAINTATFDGEFAAVSLPQLTDTRTIQIEHVSIQKGAAPFENLTPGDTVTFTLNLQISDYAEVNSIQLQDVLPDGLSFDVGSETASFGAIIASVTNNVPTNGATTLDFDLTAANGSNFTAGTSITITYTASVNASYFNGNSLLASDSLSNTVASTYGLVGGAAACVDSSATIVEIEPVTVQKEVISTGPYYPGDTVTYRLSLTVPSGDTNNVIFTDFFPLPVLFATSINTGTNLALNPDISLSPTDTLGLTPTSITTDAATNSLTINWPNITTATSQVLSVEVSLDLTTEPFDDDLSLSNLLQVSTENTGTISATAVAPVLINVKSPKVTMTKGIAATNGNGVINPAAAILPTDGNLTAADAGDTVTYVVTIENVRDRAVYDVTITDPAVVGLTACAVDSVLDGQGNALATTGNLTTGLVLTNPLPANVGATGAPYDIDTALLSYTCTIDTTAQTNTTLTNEATVTFAAVAGGTIIRRPKDIATVQITAPSLSKTILSTTPNADADNSTVTIGETIQYQIIMSIPEGTVPNSALVDNLDAGLVFQSFDSITPSNAVDISTSHGTFAGVLADATGLGTSTATFPFDNIVNTNTDNAVAETITIIYTVLVQDVAGNTSGGLRNNAAVLSYTGGTAAVNAPNVTLQEPNLTINKTVNPISADAGDTITYTMVIANTGTSMAYDAIASDALSSPFLNLNTGSVTTTQGVITTGNTLGDTTVLVTIGDIAAGASVTITFDVTLDATTPSGASIVNTGSIDGYSSLPGGSGRTYGSTTDTATVTGVAAVVTKTTLNVTSTEQSGGVAGEGNAALVDLTIGEEVTFEITATLAEGVSPSVIITDTLPNNATGHMEVTGFTIQPLPGTTNLTLTNPNPANTGATANVLELDFGSVTNVADGVVDANDQIVIQITAVVMDDAVNSGLEVLTNNVMVQYNTGLTASASSDVEIVEPRMTVNKTGSTTSADAGDIITFTITIDNLGANNSQANAFDVDLSDVIPADYTYAGNLQLNSGPAVDAGTLINNAGTIQAHWTQFDLGQSAVISYDVMVNNTVAPEQVVTNTAQLTWSSMPGANGNERSGSVSESHSVTMTAPGLVKSVINTSEASSTTAINGVEEDILIGETVTYQFTITIPEGTSAAATAVDQLPTVSTIMNVVSSQIVSIGGQLSFTPATVVVGQAGTVLDSDADTYADRVTWNLGDIFNMPDGMNNANDQITFEVVAMLVDEPVNQNGGNDIINTATFTTGLISSTDTALIDIIEPVINVTKATVPNAITADAGDVLDYQITIAHDAASNADAFNFTVTDVLPTPGTSWLGFSSSTCGAVTTDASAPPNIVFTFDALALADTSCVINYQVTVDVGVNPNETYQNTVTASYQSTDVPNAETRTNSVMDSTSFITPDPAIIKVSSTSSNSDTGNTVQDGLLADLAIGEEIDFTLTVIFPEGTTTNAVVVDSLPVFASGGMLEAVSATVDSIGANLTSSLPGTPVLSDVDGDANNINDTITFDFGTVVNTPDGAVTTADHIVITVTARVVDDAVNANLDTLTNTASFTYGVANMLSDTSNVEIVEPVLGLSKSMGPMVDHVVPVTLTFTNTGTAPAYDIVIQDVIDTTIWDIASIAAVATPAGYTFASTAGPGANQQTISYTVTNSLTDFIAPGATQVFTFNLTLLAGVVPPTTLNNTATVTEANSMPGVNANERDFSDIVANAALPIPVLDSSKTVTLVADTNGSGGASPSEELEYTIVVTNTGTGDANNVTVVDAPDANVALNIGSVTSTIGVVSIGNTAGDALVDVAVGTIPAGGSVTIVYRVTINSPLATGVDEIINQALIESDETPDFDTDDPTTAPNDDPTIISVDAAPDLVVTKTDGGISATQGATVVYTISYSNIGTQDAIGVVITETVPVNSVFNVGSSTGVWSCADGSPAGTVCTQAIGNVNAGDPIVTVDFAVTVDDPINAGETELLNNVSITDDGTNGVELDVTNNDDSDNTPFLVVPDLQIVKDDNITSILPGGSITYTLTYSNIGGQTATGVVITETVPANTTFDAGASDAAWVCAANTPGSVCTLTLGTVLGSGGTGSVLFVVTVDDPISIGVAGITNTATIADDGTNGVDPTPADNSSSHDTPVDAAPDLFVTKSDGDITSGPGQTIVYTLNYGNIGNQGATNVVLNEVVPANSTYNAGASSVAWVCAGGSTAAGTVCQFNLGIVNIGDAGSVTFAVDVDDPLALGVNQIINSVVIADDGANGMDTNPTNNTGTDDTSLQLEPPVGLKSGEFDANDDRLIHWTIWWFNPNNDRDLPVAIFDDIPTNTIYIPGSATCIADGTSSCTVPNYNSGSNRIELTAILGEDQGAAANSTPATLNNEIVITFDTRVLGTGGVTIENQAMANWDENNDGDPSDDTNNGQAPIPTNDPLSADPNDPTRLAVVFYVPAMSLWSLITLIVGIFIIFGFKRRFNTLY